MKAMIESEKKNHFQVKTLYSKEIEIKQKLENMLRQCIEDVRDEIAKKKSEV